MSGSKSVCRVTSKSLAFVVIFSLGSAVAEGQLVSEGNQVWHQDSPGVPGGAEADDRYGDVAASGDFNGDGRQDLAIGATQEAIGVVDNAGLVSILYGSETGLSATNSQIWHQDIADIPGNPNEDDRFGSAVAVGNFDGDPYDDLAIGVPNETVNTFDNAGEVHILYGSATGLTAAGNQVFQQGAAGMADVAELQDRFGGSLCAGDFNNDGYEDLAVGVSGETVDDSPFPENQGAVSVIYGTMGGLSTTLNQLWTQDSPNVPGEVEDSNGFGETLACADFDRDLQVDLAIGTRLDDVDGESQAGTVTVLYGSPGALTTIGVQLWTQNSKDIVGVAEEFDWFGHVLASGDFDGNGYDDLAITALTEDVGTATGAGSVNVIYGSAAGLTSTGNQLWHQDIPGITGTAEVSDLFGTALIAGNFDGNGYDDLAIGVLGEDIVGETIASAGVAHVIYGSISGLTVTGSQLWSKLDFSLVPEEEDFFGRSLAAADFDGDGLDSLAIGIPQHTVGVNDNAGAVGVLQPNTDSIFSDGFETGDTIAWSSSVP